MLRVLKIEVNFGYFGILFNDLIDVLNIVSIEVNILLVNLM